MDKNLEVIGKSTPATPPVSMPGFGPKTNDTSAINFNEYEVRYVKIDMDDPASIAELSILETKSLRNDGNIFILGKDKFTFMDKYFLVVSYLEKVNANNRR